MCTVVWRTVSVVFGGVPHKSFLCPQLTVRGLRTSICAGALGQHQTPLSDFFRCPRSGVGFFLDYVGSPMTAETADTFWKFDDSRRLRYAFTCLWTVRSFWWCSRYNFSTDTRMYLLRTDMFLGAFAKSRTATFRFVMPACPSAWNNSAPTGGILMKFDIWIFF